MNIPFILVTIFVTNVDRSIEPKDEQPLNILFIFLHLLVTKFPRVKEDKDVQSKNISFIVVTEETSNSDKSMEIIDAHPLNIPMQFFI